MSNVEIVLNHPRQSKVPAAVQPGFDILRHFRRRHRRGDIALHPLPENQLLSLSGIWQESCLVQCEGDTAD